MYRICTGFQSAREGLARRFNSNLALFHADKGDSVQSWMKSFDGHSQASVSR